MTRTDCICAKAWQRDCPEHGHPWATRIRKYRMDEAVLIPGTPIFGCPVCYDSWESEPSCEHYGAETAGGCCRACGGRGADLSGPCSDCYGTGCAHPDPCPIPPAETDETRGLDPESRHR